MSEMQWFRMYTDAVDNPKLRLLAFEDRWHYVAICCLQRSGLLDHEDDPVLERKIAVKMGLQVRELDEIKRRLMEVDLIDESWHPVGWNERQFVSDSSTERVRKHRNGKGKQKEKGKRFRNVSETAPSVSVSVSVSDSEKKNKNDAVDRVFEHWKTIHEHPRAKLDLKRRKLIRERLQDYSEADLCQAISGFRNSPHHMGETDGTVYDSIELFMRDSKHVDMGMKFFEKPPNRNVETDPYYLNLRRGLNANN